MSGSGARSSSYLFPNLQFSEIVTFDAGGVVMKVVLFCGGTGMRLREYSESIPKPMVPIGYRPMLWHVMKYYAHFGHKHFILCLGWKANVIKEYFLNYDECVSNNFVLESGGKSAGLGASRLELGQHRLGACDRRRRQPGKARHREAIGAVGGPLGDFVEQDEIAFPLARTDVVEAQRIAAFG